MNKTKLMLVCIAIGTLMLSAPFFAMAADVPDSSRGGSVRLNVSQPHIRNYRFFDASAPGGNITNSQINVKDIPANGQTYGFNATLYHGLGASQLNNFTIDVWFDMGVDPLGYNATGLGYQNFRFHCPVPAGPATIIYPLTGEVTLSSFKISPRSSALSPLDWQNYCYVDILFNTTAFVRWAPGDSIWADGIPPGNTGVAHTTGALDDAYSFNFNMRIDDDFHNFDNVWDEFGTYKYQVLGLDDELVTGGGAPNQFNVALSPNNAEYQCNAPHRVTLEMDTNAVGPGLPITPAAFSVSSVDTPETSFGAIDNPVIVIGDIDEPRILLGNAVGPHWFTNNSMVFLTGQDFYWQVDIPAGQAEGQYTATYTIRLVTVAAGSAATGTEYGSPLSP